MVKDVTQTENRLFTGFKKLPVKATLKHPTNLPRFAHDITFKTLWEKLLI